LKEAQGKYEVKTIIDIPSIKTEILTSQFIISPTHRDVPRAQLRNHKSRIRLKQSAFREYCNFKISPLHNYKNIAIPVEITGYYYQKQDQNSV